MCLLCARYYFKISTYINLFKSNNNPIFYRREQKQEKGKEWTGKWSTLTNATKNYQIQWILQLDYY